VGFYCTDENLGSRMKTFLSVIYSYDEIKDFIFWCSPVSSLGKDVGTNGKVGH
jgi:hypothetical protein